MTLSARLRTTLLVLFALSVNAAAQANQSSNPAGPKRGETDSQTPPKDQDAVPKTGSQSQTGDKDAAAQSNNTYGQQTKRIFGIFPNYRSVSANTTLPPQSTKQKFWLATEDSFDYSSFILAGIVAGYGQATNNIPEFHQGAAGYGRYYWHSFVDQMIGNYMTEAIVPTLSHEDPRYYTLGKGGFFRRSGYAVSRLLVTRTDQQGRTFNLSEVVGNGAAAAVSNLYYPSQERTFGKTSQKWFLQIGIDGVSNVLKEFWPDIDKALFHGKY